MSSLFLDPHKPLPGCASEDCRGCPLKDRLACHFYGRDLLRFLGIGLPPFLLGGWGIARVAPWLLLPWIGLIVGYFGLIEIRVMCSHCPHYGEPGTRFLQCWANYGVPKLWKYRPGPLTRGETSVFLGGLLVIAGYPFAIIAFHREWLLLALLALTVGVMGVMMGRLMCARCMNFACPLNRTDGALRDAFFARNPGVARAWRADQDGR